METKLNDAQMAYFNKLTSTRRALRYWKTGVSQSNEALKDKAAVMLAKNSDKAAGK